MLARKARNSSRGPSTTRPYRQPAQPLHMKPCRRRRLHVCAYIHGRASSCADVHAACSNFCLNNYVATLAGQDVAYVPARLHRHLPAGSAHLRRALVHSARRRIRLSRSLSGTSIYAGPLRVNHPTDAGSKRRDFVVIRCMQLQCTVAACAHARHLADMVARAFVRSARQLGCLCAGSSASAVRRPGETPPVGAGGSGTGA